MAPGIGMGEYHTVLNGGAMIVDNSEKWKRKRIHIIGLQPKSADELLKLIENRLLNELSADEGLPE